MTTFEERTRVHVFRDDALGEHDAVGLAEALRRLPRTVTRPGTFASATGCPPASHRARAVTFS
ncbi:hypothetical protein ABZ509_32680, partial [Streptomyces lavendulocolor]